MNESRITPGAWATGGSRGRGRNRKEQHMSLTDKVTGRIKQAADDLADDASLKREGAATV
jgi:hypothetical protein